MKEPFISVCTAMTLKQPYSALSLLKFLTLAILTGPVNAERDSLSQLSIIVLSVGSVLFVAILLGFVVWKLYCDKTNLESGLGSSLRQLNESPVAPPMMVAQSGDSSHLVADLETILEGQNPYSEYNEPHENESQRQNPGSLWTTFVSPGLNSNQTTGQASVEREQTCDQSQTIENSEFLQKGNDNVAIVNQPEENQTYSLAQPIGNSSRSESFGRE